jgi:glycosyltransferase involved in cell wall biosynthesis
MENKLKFSIAIFVDEKSLFLRECINSLIDQYYPYEEYQVTLFYSKEAKHLIRDIKHLYTPFHLELLPTDEKSSSGDIQHICTSTDAEYILFLSPNVVCATDFLAMHEKAHLNSGTKKRIILGDTPFAKTLESLAIVNYFKEYKNSFVNSNLELYSIYNFTYFSKENTSINRENLKKIVFRKKTMLKGKFASDWDLAYKLEEGGYSLFYFPEALAYRQDCPSIKELLNEQENKGKEIIEFLHKYPLLSRRHKELFGLELLSINQETSTLPENKIDEIIATLENINKIQITSSEILPTGGGKSINKSRLLDTLRKYLTVLAKEKIQQGASEAIKSKGLPNYQKWHINKDNKYKVKAGRNLKILVCADEYANGDMLDINRYIFKEFSSLAKKKIDIAVVRISDTDGDSDIKYYTQRKSVKKGVISYTIYNNDIPYTLETSPLLEIKNPMVLKRFKSILDEFQPDIVRIDSFRKFSFSIAEECHSRHIPAIYAPQDYHLIDPKLMLMRTTTESWSNTDIFANTPLLDLYPDKKEDFIKRRDYSKKVLNEYIQKLICRSDNMKNIFLEYGVSEEKLCVEKIVLLQEREFYKQKDSSELQFQYIGELSAHNGAHIITQAIQDLPNSSIFFNIIGKGNKKYINKLMALDKYPNSHYYWQLNEVRELHHFLSYADAIICPNISHNTNFTIGLLATLYGIPVITSDMGDIQDYNKKFHDALLYPADNVGELTELLRKISESPDIMMLLSQKTYFEKSYTQYINDKVKIYKNVVKHYKN